MRFLRYGIDLERLEAKDLEMVRQWRNHDAVRLRMQYQEIISPERQAVWFKTLDPYNDWYFVAAIDGSPFALFHIKKISWENKSGEAGGFVGNPELIGGIEPGLGILALMDFAFFSLGLNSLEAKYHPGYTEIATLNLQLGYEIFAEESGGFVRARVTSARYLEATEKLRKAAQRAGRVLCMKGNVAAAVAD